MADRRDAIRELAKAGHRARLLRRLRERDEREAMYEALGLDESSAGHLEHRRADPLCARCGRAAAMAERMERLLAGDAAAWEEIGPLS